MEYIRKEFKRLGSMSLIGVGGFLILEHIYTYGSIELMDLLGHEWLGIILVIAGLICANKSITKDQAIQNIKDKLSFLSTLFKK